MIEVYSTASPPMPAPRLTARSMLSFGTEVFFAFCTASNSVGLPARSAPPSLAATSMFLMSLAQDLARLESMMAFLCFVVAHLECPDISLHSSYPPVGTAQGIVQSNESRRRLPGCARVASCLVEEERVESGLTVHLGMEARAEQRPLAHRDHRAVGQGGEHLHRGPRAFHDRRPDERRRHRGIAEHRHVEVDLER